MAPNRLNDRRKRNRRKNNRTVSLERRVSKRRDERERRVTD